MISAGTVTASGTLIRPLPRPATFSGEAKLASSLAGRLALVASAALTSRADQSGWAWRTRAAEPATWGVAMLVPLNIA